MMLSAVNTFEVFHEAVSLLDIYSRLGSSLFGSPMMILAS